MKRSQLKHLKMHSHNSSGKHEHVAVVFVIFRFLGFFAANFLLFVALDLAAAAACTANFFLLVVAIIFRTLDFDDDNDDAAIVTAK